MEVSFTMSLADSLFGKQCCLVTPPFDIRTAQYLFFLLLTCAYPKDTTFSCVAVSSASFCLLSLVLVQNAFNLIISPLSVNPKWWRSSSDSSQNASLSTWKKQRHPNFEKMVHTVYGKMSEKWRKNVTKRLRKCYTTSFRVTSPNHFLGKKLHPSLLVSHTSGVKKSILVSPFKLVLHYLPPNL